MLLSPNTTYICIYIDRIDDNFDDHNKTIISQVESRFPQARTLEMETFILFHLASCSKIPIYASSAAIIVSFLSISRSFSSFLFIFLSIPN